MVVGTSNFTFGYFFQNTHPRISLLNHSHYGHFLLPPHVVKVQNNYIRFTAIYAGVFFQILNQSVSVFFSNQYASLASIGDTGVFVDKVVSMSVVSLTGFAERMAYTQCLVLEVELVHGFRGGAFIASFYVHTSEFCSLEPNLFVSSLSKS